MSFSEDWFDDTGKNDVGIRQKVTLARTLYQGSRQVRLEVELDYY